MWDLQGNTCENWNKLWQLQDRNIVELTYATLALQSRGFAPTLGPSMDLLVKAAKRGDVATLRQLIAVRAAGAACGARLTRHSAAES